jgi:DinB superfamily
MTDDRDRLLREEEEGWRRLHDVFGRIPKDRLDEPGVADGGWSAKDLMFHVGAWLAEAARQLERIRVGTYRVEDDAVEDRNEAWFALSKTLDLSTARAEFEASRMMAREALTTLPELTADARGWFEESAGMHYAEHVPDLLRWLDG